MLPPCPTHAPPSRANISGAKPPAGLPGENVCARVLRNGTGGALRSDPLGTPIRPPWVARGRRAGGGPITWGSKPLLARRLGRLEAGPRGASPPWWAWPQARVSGSADVLSRKASEVTHLHPPAPHVEALTRQEEARTHVDDRSCAARRLSPTLKPPGGLAEKKLQTRAGPT